MTEDELHEQTVTEYHEWKTRGFFWTLWSCSSGTLCSTSIKNGINLENFARNTVWIIGLGETSFSSFLSICSFVKDKLKENSTLLQVFVRQV